MPRRRQFKLFCAGTYEFFTQSAVDLASYVSSVEQHVAESAPVKDKGASTADSAVAVKGTAGKTSSVAADASKSGGPESKLMTKEERATGAVQLKVRQASRQASVAQAQHDLQLPLRVCPGVNVG